MKHHLVIYDRQTLKGRHRFAPGRTQIGPKADLFETGRNAFKIGILFSYAAADGYLACYFVFGLHENYNSESVLEAFDQNVRIACSRFEPHGDLSLKIKQAIEFIHHSGQPVGIELDMDSIADMPSSSATPSGLSVEDARFSISEMASRLPPAYLHLPEAAPDSDRQSGLRVVKTLAYLVADFIKSVHQKATA